MAFQRLSNSGTMGGSVPAPSLADLLSLSSGGQGNANSLQSVLQALSLAKTLQSLNYYQQMNAQRQMLGDLRLQKMQDQVMFGTGKEGEKNKKIFAEDQIGYQIMQNPDFRKDMRELVNSSPTKRLRMMGDIKAKYFDPIKSSYADLDLNNLYKRMFGRYKAQAEIDQRNIEESAWDSYWPTLKTEAQNTFNSLLSILPGFDTTALARENEENARKLAEESLYARDQMQRAAEGENIWSRTNGLSGWLYRAAEFAPGAAAFILPGKVATTVTKGAGQLAGALNLASKAETAEKLVRTAKLGQRVNQGAGLLTGAGMGNMAYATSVLNSSATPEEQQAAMNSPARYAATGLGAALGAIAPNPAGAFRGIATRLSPAYKAATPEARQFMLNTQPLINMSRQSVLESGLRGALNSGVGLGAMGYGQTIANNALVNAALSDTHATPIPLFHGATDAAIGGFLSGAALGGLTHAHARAKMPRLNDAGGIQASRESLVTDYGHAKNDTERQAVIERAALNYPNDKTILQRIITENKINSKAEQYQIKQWFDKQPVDPAVVYKYINEHVSSPADKLLEMVEAQEGIDSSGRTIRKVADIRTDPELATLLDGDNGPFAQRHIDTDQPIVGYAQLQNIMDAIISGKMSPTGKQYTASPVDRASLINHLFAALYGGGYEGVAYPGVIDHFRAPNTGVETLRVYFDRYFAEQLMPNITKLMDKVRNLSSEKKISSILSAAMPDEAIANMSTAQIALIGSVISRQMDLINPVGTFTFKGQKGVNDWIQQHLTPIYNQRKANPTPKTIVDDYNKLDDGFLQVQVAGTVDPANYRTHLQKFLEDNPNLSTLVEAEAFLNNTDLNALSDSDFATFIGNTINQHTDALMNASKANTQKYKANNATDEESLFNRYAVVEDQYLTQINNDNATKDLNAIFAHVDASGRVSKDDSVIFNFITENSIYADSYKLLNTMFDMKNGAGSFDKLNEATRISLFDSYLKRNENLDDLLNNNPARCI